MSLPAFEDLLLLLPGNRAAGSTSFLDRSPVGNTVTVVGNTSHAANFVKDYAASMYLDGSGDYLRCDAISTLLAGLPSFTIAGWFRHASLVTGQNTLFGFHGAGSSATNRLVYTRASAFSTFLTLAYTGAAVSTWYHFAAVISPTEARVYMDGVLAASVAITGNGIVAGDRFTIGQEFDSATATDFLHGNIQDFFVCSGELYTADFTPPASILGAISGTVTDLDGLAAIRRLVAVPRSAPLTLGASETTSASDGTYTLADVVKGAEYSVVAMDDAAGSVLPDLVQRLVAA